MDSNPMLSDMRSLEHVKIYLGLKQAGGVHPRKAG